MTRMRRISGFAVLMIFAAVCVLPVLAAAVGQVADAGGNVIEACRSDRPPGALEGVDRLRTAAVTAIPAGRTCQWEGVGTTISVQTGWPVTVVALVATAGVVVLTVLALIRASEWQRRVLAVLPALATVLIWLFIRGNMEHVIIG